jgi:hypothetical protein
LQGDAVIGINLSGTILRRKAAEHLVQYKIDALQIDNYSRFSKRVNLRSLNGKFANDSKLILVVKTLYLHCLWEFDAYSVKNYLHLYWNVQHLYYTDNNLAWCEFPNIYPTSRLLNPFWQHYALKSAKFLQIHRNVTLENEIRGLKGRKLDNKNGTHNMYYN